MILNGVGGGGIGFSICVFGIFLEVLYILVFFVSFVSRGLFVV